MGTLSISVDLDEVRCYHDIHGLAAPEGDAARAVYERALPRALRFLEDLGVRGTLFAVGRDLAESPQSAAALRDAASSGLEIGNHTWGHRYDLTVLGTGEQREEIRRGADAIREATGASPAGFRAPGYNVHLGLLDLLADEGYAYDSSVFPCP